MFAKWNVAKAQVDAGLEDIYSTIGVGAECRIAIEAGFRGGHRSGPRTNGRPPILESLAQRFTTA
jgi:hypothetical protein